MKVRVSHCELERTAPEERIGSFTTVLERCPQPQCTTCRHFVAFIPARDGSPARVRCVFLDTDSVESVMTPDASLVTIDGEAPLDAAATIAKLARVGQIPVTDGDEIVGLARTYELVRDAAAHPRARVATRAQRPIPVVPSTASLGEVASVLRRFELSCVLVVDGDEATGIVTRNDLRTIGVPMGEP